MVAIKYQLDNVFFGHFGQLTGEDIFQVKQELERLMIAIVPDNFESNFVLLLLGLGGIVAGSESQADILNNQIVITSPCIPTKLLLVSLLGSTYICAYLYFRL